jgi:hypothetical protein
VERRDEDRFWSKVEVGGDCWDWVGGKFNNGYGSFWVKERGNNRVAHQVSYELLVGPIPDGLELDHLCRNRGCVRPTHLEAVTSRINLLRGSTLAAKNAAKTECDHGHPFDEANTLHGPKGQRFCRTCARDRQRQYRLRQKG